MLDIMGISTRKKDRYAPEAKRQLTIGNFLNPSSPSFLGGSVSPVIPEGIGFLVGGPAGAAAAGAFYGGVSSGGGFSGALTGGLQGYGLGSALTDLTGYGGYFGGAGASAAGASFFGPSSSAAFDPSSLSADTTFPSGVGGGEGGAAGLAGSGGGGGFSDWVSNLWKNKTGGSAWNAISSIGSGLYGMKQANDIRNLSANYASMADPWGASGGRATAAQQLIALNTPGGATAAMNSDPRFAAMLQAAKRSSAMYGEGSGNMAVAAAGAGGNWLTQRMAELSGQAGIGNAGIAGQIGLTGANDAANLASKSLASIGYGGVQAGGGGQLIPPAIAAWLKTQGIQ